MIGVAVERQIRDLLRADAGVLAAMRLGDELASETASRVVDQPLKREGMTDPELAANDPTPQCFDPFVPYWVRPSIAVVMGVPVAASSSREARYMSGRYTVAYYAGPDVADVVIWQIRSAVMAVLDGGKVWYPDGLGAHLRAVHDMSSIVDIPEFPDAGKVMLERVAAYSVWRRT